MIPNRIKFSVAFSSLPHPVEDVWSTIVSILDANQCLPREFSLSQIVGHPESKRASQDLVTSPAGVGQMIRDRNLRGFDVITGFSSDSLGISLKEIKNTGNPARLKVRIENDARTPPTWNGLIEALLVQWSCIGAWQWKNIYWGWQNHCFTEGYERLWGKVPSGVTCCMEQAIDGIALARELISISANPGRTKSILPGIDFFPTAEMWLGPHFWQYAKCKKEEALAADFFIEKRDTPHFLYLKCWPQPFTRPDGEQGRIQQKLWKLFFHEDCEWPPGSGGICDEPMYGPLELTP